MLPVSDGIIAHHAHSHSCPFAIYVVRLKSNKLNLFFGELEKTKTPHTAVLYIIADFQPFNLISSFVNALLMKLLQNLT